MRIFTYRWQNLSILQLKGSLSTDFWIMINEANLSLIDFFLHLVFIFEVGSLICAVAPTSIILVLGRAIAGIGGSGLFSGGLTIIGASLPAAKRARKSTFLQACRKVKIF